ncbi:hypothetical protein ACFLZK_01560 [Patescibacteria group bacterium]
MRKSIAIIIICLVFVIFQESFMLEFFGGAINPNLIIALAFSFMFIDDYRTAMFTALVGGIFLDFLGVGIIGLSSFLLILFLLFSRWIKKTIFRGIWIQIVMIIVSTIVFKLVINYPDMIYSGKILFSGLINSIISSLIFLVLNKIRQRYLSIEYRIKA